MPSKCKRVYHIASDISKIHQGWVATCKGFKEINWTIVIFERGYNTPPDNAVHFCDSDLTSHISWTQRCTSLWDTDDSARGPTNTGNTLRSTTDGSSHNATTDARRRQWKQSPQPTCKKILDKPLDGPFECNGNSVKTCEWLSDLCLYAIICRCTCTFTCTCAVGGHYPLWRGYFRKFKRHVRSYMYQIAHYAKMLLKGNFLQNW